LIFKGSTKSLCLTNVKVSVLLDNVLQRYSWGCKKTYIFYFKKLFNAGTEMRRGYPNPSGTGMRFNFSSPLDIYKVTDKYIKIGYKDREGKTHPHSTHCHAYSSICVSTKCYEGWYAPNQLFSLDLFHTSHCLLWIFVSISHELCPPLEPIDHVLL